MDLSSEPVHSLLAVFFVGTLGASMLTVGLSEGIAEATALIVESPSARTCEPLPLSEINPSVEWLPRAHRGRLRRGFTLQTRI